MPLFPLTTVTEDREHAVVNLDRPNAPLPVILHLFGKDQVDLWDNGSDTDRAGTALAVVTDLLKIRLATGKTWQEAVTFYNQLVPDGSHAFEFIL